MCVASTGRFEVIEHSHQPILVLASIAIAIFASYTALDLANSIWAARGRARASWLAGGSIAMGVGIWSMHFVAMLALRADGLRIAYNIAELVLSVVVAILASGIALHIVSRPNVTVFTYTAGSLSMGAAIAGMHYIGMASMRMAATIEWVASLVGASIVIAVSASLVALVLAFRLRGEVSRRGFARRVAAGVVMGAAIAGMHYTGMAAMRLHPGPPVPLQSSQLLATSGLAVAVVLATLAILGIALTGSIVDRALATREAIAGQITRILESISDAFYSVDRDWRFSYVNTMAREAMGRSLGHDPGPLIGRVLWQAMPFIVGTPFEREYRRAMRDHVPVHVEGLVESRDEWIEAHAYPAPDGVSIYFRNIDERKRNEQALQSAIRVRDEFLSIASHELKTPLTSLKLQIETRLLQLQKGDRSVLTPENLGAALERDRRQIERLTHLIDDMLDIARIASGKLTLRRERVDLCALVRDVIESYQPQIAQVGASISVTHCKPVLGHWDRFRIEQVFVNLLTNALRYGDSSPIDIEVGEEAGTAHLVVRDHGRGIARADQERIFQRFERVESGEHLGGLGIGLFISRQIVEMHGGTIGVRSEVGEGATFCVELPTGGSDGDNCEDEVP